MIGQEQQRRGGGVAVGLMASVVVHAALIGGALLLQKTAEAERETFKNIIDLKLVRLGTPLPEKALPRLEAAPTPPPPDLGEKVTKSEKPPVEKPKPPPPKRKLDAEEELKLRLQLQAAASSPRRTGAGGSGKHATGDSRRIGDPSGDPAGEVASIKDQMEGSRWAAEVRRTLHSAWAIPEVISDTDLARLFAVVVVQIEEDGSIRSWSWRTRSRNSLFDGSVSLVFAKVKKLPPPPPGALKVFRGGKIGLKFSKAEAEKSR